MKNENTKLLEDFKRKYITNNKNIKKKVLTNNAAYEGEIVNKKPTGKGIFIFHFRLRKSACLLHTICHMSFNDERKEKKRKDQ